ncbi:MAG: PKD domain-containing protein [Candidatus Acidiferrales bacterium]
MMFDRKRRWQISVRALQAATLFILFSPVVCAQDATIRNSKLVVTVRAADGSYSIQAAGAKQPGIQAIVGAELDGRWIKSSDFPTRQISESGFEDGIGQGHQITVTSTGIKDRPSLVYIVRLYDAKPFGEIVVEVRNETAKTINVQSIRSVEAIGERPIYLGEKESSDRILSDSFSEDWPPMQIYDLGKAPKGLHLGVGSQLIYNPDSGQSLFFGALTSDRLLTILHLMAGEDSSKEARIASFSVDSTGTTEIQTIDEESGLREGPAENRIELSLPLAAGASMSSERLMFAAGDDYHAQLESYGAAIRELHRARVRGDNLLGWWSWTAFYYKITSGDVLTNAQWLAQHLRAFGYRYVHIDEGYQYARGEYATPDATRFPNGLFDLEHEIADLGLTPGIWTAPFEVTDRSWVYQIHKDWLVHNARGEPIGVGNVDEGIPDHLFVLDATNPGAQDYLRQTYRTLVRDWGVRYIKLDFMDTTAIEGYYYKPHATALEAQRIGLEVIRKAVGDDVLLDKDGSPMLNVVGIVNEGRVSQDTGHSFEHSLEAAPGIFARYYMNRNFFVNDPDAFTVSKQILDEHPNPKALTLNEAQVSIVLAALSGGMYEIGDDLPTLGADADRVALVENADLLQIAKLGRAAVPVDLLTYSAEDKEPSVVLLKEDKRQAMLAVFNWTGEPRSHSFTLSGLKFSAGHPYELYDVLNGNQRIALDGETLRLDDQPGRSVKLIKIIDVSVPAAAPSITLNTPEQVKIGESIHFFANASDDGVPAIEYLWDFGDGIALRGGSVAHTYTHAGKYTVHLRAEGVDGISAEKSVSITVSGEMELSPPRRYVREKD